MAAADRTISSRVFGGLDALKAIASM